MFLCAGRQGHFGDVGLRVAFVRRAVSSAGRRFAAVRGEALSAGHAAIRVAVLILFGRDSAKSLGLPSLQTGYVGVDLAAADPVIHQNQVKLA